jgi:hypothetical protein
MVSLTLNSVMNESAQIDSASEFSGHYRLLP